MKSQFTHEEGEVVDGGVKVIDYVPWWKNLSEVEEAKPHGIRYTIIVKKWGKEIIDSGNGFLETLKKTGKIILPFLVLTYFFLLV